MNGNEHDPRAGGGTCFGDSGGPAIHGGYVVGDTSYGYTNNCRYLGGYQRVDIPVVRDWLLDCTSRPGLPDEGVAERCDSTAVRLEDVEKGVMMRASLRW